MSLASAIKQTKKTNTSSKNPQFYNREKNRFIAQMVGHEDEAVRIAACKNAHVPAKTIQARLEIEQELEVIKAILMNPNLPKKALIDFTKDDRAELFDDDQELIDYVKGLELTEAVEE